jgi:hypothetical protein
MPVSRSRRNAQPSGRKCKIEECPNPAAPGRPHCYGHYKRKRRTGREPEGELRHYGDPETAFQEAALNYGELRDEYFSSAAAYSRASAEDQEEFRRAKARLWMAGKRLFGASK